MNKTLFFLLIPFLGLAQNHVIHNNATSVTILPSSIATSRNSNFSNNLSLGNNALSNIGISVSNNNVALGHSALNTAYDGNLNVAVGNEAGLTSVYSDRNVLIGHKAMRGTGPSSGSGNNNDDNIAIGVETLFNVNFGNMNNIAIGNFAMRGASFSCSNNIAIGYSAGYTANNGGNLFLGHQSGYLNTGNGNLFLGHSAGYNETGNNKLYIENSNSSAPLIGGDFVTDKIGINRLITDLASRSEKFQVSGDAYISGNLVVNTTSYSSDIRYKKNIQNLENPLSLLKKIRGTRYVFNTEIYPEMPTFSQIGLIAQEVEIVYPELVKTDANGYKSVDYARLTPILLEAVKVLNQRLEEVEKMLLPTK